MVPLSFELRKALLRHCKEMNSAPSHLLFANRTQTGLTRENVRQDVKLLCRKLGFDPPASTVHSFR
jgi:integrase/recombinase XerD